jgi:polyhydroxybutyrate depolymerase
VNRWLALTAFALTAACSSSNASPPPSAAPAVDAAAPADEPDAGPPAGATCEPDTKPGDPAGSTKMKTAKGTAFVVRTPKGYDPLVGAPLLVVYAPAGITTPTDTEDFTGLTKTAQPRGYIVAYPDHLAPSSTANITDAASVVKLISDNWCVDPKRIYLSGHSDGATIAELLTIRGLVKPAAIAASASGMKATGVGEMSCPEALVPEMEIHGSRDALFPIADGYGSAMADWWAKCNSCDPSRGAADELGCMKYASCKDGLEIQYCQWTGGHPNWSGSLDKPIIDFFDRFKLP